MKIDRFYEIEKDLLVALSRLTGLEEVSQIKYYLEKTMSVIRYCIEKEIENDK